MALSVAGATSRPTVLIGFAESLAAIESAWMLLDAGYDVVAFTRRGARPALRLDPGVRTVEVTSPGLDWPSTCAEVAGLAAACGAVAVLPLDDDAVWLCDHAAATASLPPVAGPRGDAAVFALDKSCQLQAARTAGLDVPPTVVVDPGTAADGLDALPGGGPWVVKPSRAVRVEGDRLTRGRATTSGERRPLREHLAATPERVLVQPRLVGTGEGLFGHAAPAGVVAWSAHRRVRMLNPSGSGSSACASTDPPVDLLAPSARLLTSVGWDGLFMLEFLRDHAGTAWFMELNGRTWGSMALARHRGWPYPVWAVRAATEPGFVPDPPPPGGHVTARHLGRDLLHLAFVARGTITGRAEPGWPTVGGSARSVLHWDRGERFYNLRPGGRRVFLDDTWRTVRLAARSRA